jgi:hypothetical protein
MSEIKVNKITPKQNCTQVTLGDSGDSFVIPSGVTITNNGTQTGFGRTGTVDWDTTAKTAGFTAVSGNGYFVDTTSGAITVTLPASPSAGDIVAVSDYAKTSETNNITMGRNGSNIEGAASDFALENNGIAMTFVYVDSTKGWKVVNAGTQTDSLPGPGFIEATGGTITECGNFKIHTFTGPGTFTVSSAGNDAGSNTVDYLVVAGGGGGGAKSGWGLAGGGAGGYRESSGAASGSYSASPLGACVAALPVTAQGYSITVGAGGSGGTNTGCSNCAGGISSGANSVFSTIISTGGGKGGNVFGPTDRFGSPGGSGGGGGACGPASPGDAAGGTGNTPPVSPPQGNNGGNGGDGSSAFTAGGGGGGAGAAGTNASPIGSPGCNADGGNGGNGVASSISGSPVTRAGGGGGSTNGSTSCSTFGTGGTGGGGDGRAFNTPNVGPSCQAGVTNSGGGGGGGGGPLPGVNGGNGGSGIVIIRYKFQ